MSADRTVLLNTLAFTAVRLASAGFDAFTTRLLQSLAAPVQDGAPDDGGLRERTAERLRRHAPVFHSLLRDALQQSLLAAIDAAAVQGRAALRSGALDLSLQDFDAMQRRVQIENLAQALDLANADQLAILGMRITHWLWPDELRTVPNPFRAEVFLAAAADAWDKFEREPGSLALFLAQLRPAVFLPLDALYEALSGELQSRGVLPDAERRYWSEIPELTVAVTPTLRDMLQAWLAPEGTLKLIPARAAALLDGMFEQLANDSRLPFRARKTVALIGQALAPSLQADSEFFFSDAHAARRLLCLAFDAALASGDGSDAVSQALAALPDHLAEAQPAQGASLDRLSDALRAALDAYDRGNTEALAAHKTEALRQEAGAAAAGQARADIAARLETGEVDAIVEHFLQEQWAEVLAFAYRVQDSKPELLPAVTRAMDDLVWTLKPKAGADERRRMVERLPSLVATLNAWMNVIKWQGEAREAFFAALAERHAAALRPAGDARQELEQRMETVRKASEHQLDRRATEQQQAADAAFMPTVEGLAPGSWVELVRKDGNRVNCRLCWVSPGRSRLVFIQPQTRRVFMLRAEELARALRAERAALIPVAARVEQAIADALALLRG
ncbi:MAG TPA: DUF1631 family protein [Noviherbaspirillum sp.]|jgi:hypothetical protein|uniref:DUF1631 family protein n=1 Tax=Noviherbaspirillum sp. TaxID=1926288 RepID=UPI002F9466E3